MRRVKYICPLLVVENIERSRQFYENVMQQTVRYDYGENVTFHGDFAIHLADHYRTLLDGHDVQYRSHSFELYFEMDDVDAFYAAHNDDLGMIHPPREQPWRQKVMRFYDPDGHVLEVGESLQHTAYRLLQEGLSEDRVSAILTMPVDFVREAAKQYKD